MKLSRPAGVSHKRCLASARSRRTLRRSHTTRQISYNEPLQFLNFRCVSVNDNRVIVECRMLHGQRRDDDRLPDRRLERANLPRVCDQSKISKSLLTNTWIFLLQRLEYAVEDGSSTPVRSPIAWPERARSQPPVSHDIRRATPPGAWRPHPTLHL
jgi:hypothetical protein